MDLDGIGHFDHLQSKKLAIWEAARKRGMSEAALARLPRPIVPKREMLPPVVLATRAHATNIKVQEGSRQSALARGAGKDFQSRPWISSDHLREMVDAAARHFKLTGKEISTVNRDRATTAARHVVVVLVLDLTGATQSNLASAMGVSLDIVKSSRDYGRSVINNYAGHAEKYEAAKGDILARWPQYRSAA